MALTGKAAFDVLATAAAPFVGQTFTINGIQYKLHECASVTGPYLASCSVSGFYRQRLIVEAGVDALVVRYATTGQGKKVDPVTDLRVLTGIEVPDNPTNNQLKEILDRFLEDAR